MKNDIIVAIDKLTVKSSSVEYPIFTVKLRVTFTYIFSYTEMQGRFIKTQLVSNYTIQLNSPPKICSNGNILLWNYFSYLTFN